MFLQKLKDFFFPKTFSCNSCGYDIFDEPKGFCPDCLKTLPYLSGKVCYHCNEPMISDGDYCIRCKGKKFYVDRAIAPFSYDDIIKKLIHDLKYNNRPYLAESLAVFMAESFKNSNLTFDLIIPVPLCEKRMKSRGYNQSEYLAKGLEKIFNVAPSTDILIRVKETPTQTDLTTQQRKANMKDAFKVINKNAIKDKIILLVDDVYTTGATTTECAKILKEKGAKVVYVLTASHTVIKNKDKDNLKKISIKII